MLKNMFQKNKNIDAILFDYGEVLVNKKNQLSPIADDIGKMLGEIPDKKLVKQLMKKHRINKTEFNKLADELVNAYEPYLPLWNLLPLLRKNYKLAMIRDGSSLVWPGLKTKDKKLLKNFNSLVLAGVENFKKPDRRMYLLAAQRLNVQPKRCLFIDDLPAHVRGAKKLGMKTLWWRNPDDGLKKLLKILKV